MKRLNKTIIPISVAVTMLLSATTAMALPNNTVVLGHKAYSTNALFNNVSGIQDALDEADSRLYFSLEGQTNGFVGLFDNKEITQEQKDELSNIKYVDYDEDEFNRSTYAEFDDPEPTSEPISEVITVNSANALSQTTIKVTFSDNVVKTFSDYNLVDGSNNVTFTYEGETYNNTVTYVAPVIAAAVEDVEFVNYRKLTVTFSTIVDKASAEEPKNYYFEIVDGDATVYGALPTLMESNQLSKIETEYGGGASNWWKNHIYATNINNKTVVNIELPEDARFTTLEDSLKIIDDERTLTVQTRTSKTGPVYFKELIKEKSLNVAVRNVKDKDGNFTIDTKVRPILILDEVKPVLNKVFKIKENSQVEMLNGNLGKELGEFSLLRTLAVNSQKADKMSFVYSEPVFDAHDLDMSDLEYFRNIRVYVNGSEIASTLMDNLDEYLKFDMSTNSTYESAKVATLDAEKLVLRALQTNNELFYVNKKYNIRIVGVTDLAGNIEESSEHNFIVKFYDNAVSNVIVIPEVVEVKQVADNIFRVEFNRADVEGVLKIKNPDGEGIGELELPIVKSQKFIQSDEVKYYSYVAVPARDHETNGSVPQGLVQNQVLAYDKQDVIYRDVSIEKVRVSDITGQLNGNSEYKNNMMLENDIKAPIVVQPEEIMYNVRGNKLKIPVKDVVPWINDANITHWVSPIAYKYDSTEKIFTNDILSDQVNKDTFLPVIVSYEDSNSAIHKAVVSNYDLRPYIGAPADLNLGYPGSIDFDFNSNELVLDLTKYPELLDLNGKLVGGATYKAEIQSGAFTDSPRDLKLNKNEIDFSFGGNNYDILYVDQGRDNDNYWFSWFGPFKVDAGLGYTSKKEVVNVDVEVKPNIPPIQYVPQTSKQKINYDEVTDTMRIEFTGNIDVDSLKNKNNYIFDGKSLTTLDQELNTNTVIEYQIDNSDPNDIHKFGVFKVPQDSIQETGNYSFVVQDVKHPNGAKMTRVETVVRLMDNYRPVVLDAEVTGDKQIKLTFNEPIKYLVDVAVKADSDSAARNFKINIGGQVWTVNTAVLPLGRTNEREVTLNLGNVIPDDGDITVEIVEDQNGNILLIDDAAYKNPIKTATYNVDRP